MKSWFSGKKTYAAAAGAAVVAILYAFGVIDLTVANALWGALGAAGVAFLRMGVAKGR